MVAGHTPRKAAPQKTANKALVRYPKASSALRRLVNDLRNQEAHGSPAGRNDDMAPVLDATGELKPSEAMRRLVDSVKRSSAPLVAVQDVKMLRRPSSTPVTIGRTMRERRTALKLSQQDLADAAGVGRRFVSELEAGKATAELGKVIAVGNALGLTLIAVEQDYG